MTKHTRPRNTLSSIYSRLEDNRSAPRYIKFDDEGPTCLLGQQGTNEVWYAERMGCENDEMDFRVLLIRPTHSKGIQMNHRMGRPEFGTRLTSCQYMVGDVTVPSISRRANLGQALRPIQEQFRHVQRSNPVETGQLRSNNDADRIVERLFVVE